MNTKKEAPSNRLAKEYLLYALIQLTKSKPLSSISISELCNKAGVARITFYRNYQSKEDIYLSRLTEIFEEYKYDCSGNDDGLYCDYSHAAHYFDYIYKHRAFFDALINCGFDILFLNKINEYMDDRWGHIEDKTVLTAYAGAIYNMFRMWSSSGYSGNREDLINCLVDLFSSHKA